MSDYKLTFKQLKESIKQNLMMDEMISYFIDNDLMDILKEKINRKVESFCEDDINNFAIFKMNLTLKYNNKKYTNTDTELFDLFMESMDDAYYLVWNETDQKFKLGISEGVI